ncbi:unnamed protein product, partial [Vitis vinifera]|uniref:Replication protein A 14 kDa subunit B n=1 Tax=Vitis vinifera TaxID=29760 RepID=D7SSE7_VITVI
MGALTFVGNTPFPPRHPPLPNFPPYFDLPFKSPDIDRFFRRQFEDFRRKSLCWDMDTSSPAVFVNAELLRTYVGRKVRAVVQVIGFDGGVVTGKSVDDQQLIIKGSPPSVPVMNYIEVIGIADSNQSIRAEIWTNFGSTFDTHSYNQLCLLANGEFKSLFL